MKGVFMICRFPRALSLIMVITAVSGCSSRFAGMDKKNEVPDTVILENEVQPDTVIQEESLPYVEVPAQATYPEEEAALARFLQLYEDSITALDDGDFSLAEAKIDSAAVLSADIDIIKIEDETLALRFTTVLASFFQEYGRIFQDVDTINQEDPLNWLEELSETDPEQFKNGLWKDDELRKIVQKIALRCDVPIDYNDEVKKAIYFFQTVKKQEMAKWMRRSGRFMPLILDILEEEEMPLDLAYVAMIESGFSPRAYSRAHCSGLWQFYYSTGRLYGLTRTAWYDERRDPLKSTRAAIKHMKDLYKLYSDWRLVMAAYNWGPTRITRQFNAGNDDYWTMSMPRETRNYVPSFMAAVVISKAPELFGFENIEYESPMEYDIVEVPYLKLSTAAECAGVALHEIKDLNTELLKDYTPASGDYPLRIPKGTKDRFLTQYAKIPKEKYVAPRQDTYIVRSGDTLSGIAQRFRVSVNSLMVSNNIVNPRRLRVGQALSIPGRASSSTSQSVQGKPVTAQEVTEAKKNTASYTVRRNDSLWLIAKRHNTTITMLKALNNLAGTKIIPGQNLLVPAEASTLASAAPVVSNTITDGSGEIVYIIRQNDTLYDIARKYGVSYQDIMKWNQIKNHRTIKPGQKIIIKKQN